MMETFHIWRKRWILTTCLVILALSGTGVAVLKMPRTYQAASTVVLLASRNFSKATAGGNPYLSFTSSLSTTAGVVESEVMDPQTAMNLKAQGYPESYQVVSQSTVSNSELLPAPFLLVTVTGDNKALVEHTLYGVTHQISVTLHGLQARVSHNNQISLFTASFDPRAALSVTSTARPLVLVLAVMLLLGLAVPLVVDAWSVRRESASRRAKGTRPPLRTDQGSPVAQSREEGSYDQNGTAARQSHSAISEDRRELYYSARRQGEQRG
jgi:hypothetical protein